jgi:hypothetical protein
LLLDDRHTAAAALVQRYRTSARQRRIVVEPIVELLAVEFIWRVPLLVIVPETRKALPGPLR